MIKTFLEDFKKPEYKELDPDDQGSYAKTYVGTNEKGSKFFRKTENAYWNIYRNYIIHELFAYINKGAGKTIIPIPKHYEYDVNYNKRFNQFIVEFTSSSFTNATTAHMVPDKKKRSAMNDFLNSKFMIPFMLIGSEDFHGGNKIVNLKKMSGYGIDFSADDFTKSYVPHGSTKYKHLHDSPGKIPKKLRDVRYAKYTKDGIDEDQPALENKKLHRYYQELFFYHNFLSNNKKNFKKMFDDAKQGFIKAIQREYLKIADEDKKRAEPVYKDMIGKLESITKIDYGIFIRNLIKVIGWTSDQMKEIEEIKGKNDKENT